MYQFLQIEKVFFSEFFLNKDISLNNECEDFKFSAFVEDVHKEGSVYLGPSFYFMKSRK